MQNTSVCFIALTNLSNDRYIRFCIFADVTQAAPYNLHNETLRKGYTITLTRSSIHRRVSAFKEAIRYGQILILIELIFSRLVEFYAQ